MNLLFRGVEGQITNVKGRGILQLVFEVWCLVALATNVFVFLIAALSLLVLRHTVRADAQSSRNDLTLLAAYELGLSSLSTVFRVVAGIVYVVS